MQMTLKNVYILIGKVQNRQKELYRFAQRRRKQKQGLEFIPCQNNRDEPFKLISKSLGEGMAQ